MIALVSTLDEFLSMLTPGQDIRVTFSMSIGAHRRDFTGKIRASAYAANGGNTEYIENISGSSYEDVKRRADSLISRLEKFSGLDEDLLRESIAGYLGNT